VTRGFARNDKNMIQSLKGEFQINRLRAKRKGVDGKLKTKN